MSTFTARFAGRCATACGRHIRPGDEVCYDADGGLSHVECEAREERPREVCPACWLQAPCGCDD